MKNIIVVIFLLLVAMAAKAQYVTAGRIEYERKINVHAQMAEMDNNEWFEKIKAQIPKFSTSYFDLVFDTTRSLYKPGREVEGNAQFKMFGGGPATENVVYTDFKKEAVKANKSVYEQKFLVQDSMRSLSWTLKDELRTIAGYTCRKAVSKICDSVYVVAFYTEDIMVSGGPEMFGGLPGIILELGVPRLHTTWVATKVELAQPKETDFTIPEKGKMVTQQQLYETLQASLKNWGKMAARNIWWSML